MADASPSAAGLRVLQLHWPVPPTTGGVESHVADLARMLAERGAAVTVLTGERDPHRSAHYAVVSTGLLDLERIRRGTDDARDRAALRGLVMGLMHEAGIGIVHAHNLHHFWPVPALVLEELRREAGLRVFHTFHETWPDLLRDFPVYRAWDGNTAPSRFVARRCRELLGFAPEVLPLGVDTRAFAPGRGCFDGAGVPVVLHPARLLPWKGVHVSLRMLRTLLNRGHPARLVITDTQRILDWSGELAGYRRDVLAEIEATRLGPHVEFRGVAYADMPRLYEAADVIVYPTVGEEPYGLVPIEAMSCGRPVVASRSGGIPETVEDGVTGYIVPPGDAGALADRVGQLLSDPPLARAFGAAGRRRVEAHFGADLYLDALLRRYSGTEGTGPVSASGSFGGRVTGQD